MEDQIKPSMMKQIKDKVDTTLRLPVIARLKKRVKEIQELSKAKIIKIPMGNTHTFETIEPQAFITDFSTRLENGVGVISYSTYKKDGKDKEVKYTYSEIINSNGDKVKVPVSASYIIDKVVVERIEHLKKIQREVMDYE